MTHQRTTSRLAFIARPEASRAARAMAAVRLGIGAIGVLAPGRLAWRLFLPGRQADEATALRPPATSRWALARRSRPGAGRGRSAAGYSPPHSSTAATRSPSPGASQQARPYVR
jgi:hypothetical protein